MRKLLMSLALVATGPLKANPLELCDDLSTNIYTYFDLNSLGSMSLTCKKAFTSLNKDSVSGRFLRKESLYTITSQNDGVYFLKEFLDIPRQQIVSVKNIDKLFLDRPTDFLALIKKSAPYTLEAIEQNLKSFHQDVFQIDKLIGLTPLPSTPQEKLSYVLLENIIWSKILVRVKAQINAYIKQQKFQDDIDSSQIKELIWFPIWDGVANKIWSQVTNPLNGEGKDQISKQIMVVTKSKLDSLFATEVRDRFAKQLFHDLNNNFKLESRYQNSKNEYLLKKAVEYLYVFYQLGSLPMRQKDLYKEIRSELADLISIWLTDTQITKILEELDLSLSSENNYIIDTFIKLLSRPILKN